MLHRYHQPSEHLDHLVRTILVVEDAANTAGLPMIPQGTPTLICLLEKGKAQETFLFAKTLDVSLLEGKENFSFIAFFFKPFITAPLFGISAEELATDPIGIPIEMANTGSAEERLLLLQGFLQGLATKNHIPCRIIETATDWMVANPTTRVLAELVDELGISERTLQRVFQRYLGHTPNQVRRICQFYSAFEQLRSEEFRLLSDVAYEQGYADQSHFIRAFKEFTDKSPHAYLKHGLDPSKG